MAERSRIDRLDQAIEALLARSAAPPSVDSEIEPLVTLAAGLRHLPRTGFRAALKSDLTRRAPVTMTTPAKDYRRPGLRTLTPYLVVTGAARLIDFFKAAFGAEEMLRVPRPDGSIMHAEVQIGDSRVELADASERYGSIAVEIHLYVPDADAAYQRAIAAGAASLYAPMDQEYGDREAGVKDPAGNHWYLATHRLAPGRYAPAGLHDVTPCLHARGAEQLLEFLKQAFLAEEFEIYRNPEGAIVHGKVRVGDSMLEIAEAHGQWGPMPGNLHLYVPDADSIYRRALAAGATSTVEPSDTDYGDRFSGVVDAVGNRWYIATHLR